jgi:uncharacterized protein YndB with AHSA1/START domain
MMIQETSRKSRTTIVAEPGKQELLVSREFDAPRELVFRAHVDPALFVRWYGCKDLSTALDRFEPTSGGAYRLAQTFTDGRKFAVHGVYHEVAAPERIVKTFELEGFSGHCTLEITRFESLAGERTRVVTHTVFQSVSDRDGMVLSGVEKGSSDAHDRLSRLLEELAST